MRELEFTGSDGTVVKFRVHKMLAVKAEPVLLKHGIPLFRGATQAEITKGEDFWKLVVSVITNAPYEEYLALRTEMFKEVEIKLGDDEWRPLRGNEEFAFEHLDPAHILLVVAEAFFENFSGSYAVIKSQVHRLAPFLQILFGP